MVLAIKRPLSRYWIPILTAKKGRPHTYWGKEEYGLMLVTERGINAGERVAQGVSESDRFDSSRFPTIAQEECTR